MRPHQARDNVTVENIPQELRDLPQWCVIIESGWKNGNRNCLIAQPNGNPVVPTDPTTYSSFNDCLPLLQNNLCLCLGFILTDQGRYIEIHLPNAIDEEENLSVGAKIVLGELRTYSEISQSGKDVQIIAKLFTDSPDGDKSWCRCDFKVEGQEVRVYDTHHCVAITGNRLPDSQKNIDFIDGNLIDLLRFVPHDTEVEQTQNLHITDFVNLPAVVYELNEYGNARRFYHRYRDDFMYISKQNQWLKWSDKHWVECSPVFVFEAAREIAFTLKEEAMREAAESAYELRGEDVTAVEMYIVKWADKSIKQSVINASIEHAKSKFAIDRNGEIEIDFDKQPYLLNVLNGTIDLRTGELREHRRDDYLTKLIRIPFDPAARSELWERTLDLVTHGDREHQLYLQRWFGYCCTGETGLKAFGVVAGPRDSGKTTVTELIHIVLDGYSKRADVNTFLNVKGDVGGSKPRPDLARLAGARFVSTSEVDAERQLAEGLVKAIASGDRIAPRTLFKIEEEYKPQFKLNFVVNDIPVFTGTDDAIWRRFWAIPFPYTIPENERRDDVRAELENNPDHQQAILAWLVEGARQFYELRGIPKPQVAIQAIAEQRAVLNPVDAVIEEGYIVDPDGTTRLEVIVRDVNQYCVMHGLSKLTEKNICKILRIRFHATKVQGVRVWRGFRPRDERDELRD